MNMNFSKDELQKFDKEVLISLLLAQQNQLKELNNKMDLLIEQITLGKQQRFGRSSEKLDIDDGQLSAFLNEAEAIKANYVVAEPDMEDVTGHKRKKKAGKRDEDLKDLPVVI